MTNRQQSAYTFGIEEEYFLVGTATGELVSERPEELLAECKAALGAQVSAEFQRSQVEVATKVCVSPAEARAELTRLRSTLAALATPHGLAPIAASTHPLARWGDQRHTDKERYNSIAHDLQVLGRRMVAGGMHVHVGIDDNDLRIAVMNELRAFLPLLLALSTSSPFWQGEDTGLKSYRTAINDATPRSGMPEAFLSWSQYQGTIDLLVRAGVIEDATKVWWDLRPSARFPTLELRITDVCSLIDDALCIAALFRCLCRCLLGRISSGQPLASVPLLLLNENRWRAQRYGLKHGFVDPNRGKISAARELIDELLDLIQDDAENLASKDEVDHVRNILARGTSADRQRALNEDLLSRGLPSADALKRVVECLMVETVTH